jgi:glutamate dehydrogenase
MRIATRPGAMLRAPDVRALEKRLVDAMRRWEDDLHAALVERHGEERANQLFSVYANAFPASYREEYAVRDAAGDIDMIETLDPKTDLGMNLHESPRAEPGTLRFKIYRRGSRLPLSDTLPMLERLGVRVQFEHPHKVEPAGAAPVWVVDFGLAPPAGARPLADVRESFHEAFFGMWSGAVEADPLNRLVLSAGLKPGEIVVLRAYARYLNQTGSALSLSYVEQALAANPGVASLLVRLFFSRFNPNGKRDESGLTAQIEAALDEVENLDEDRILRSFLAVVQATTRTNYFLERPYLSFKLDPKRVPGLPEPRPMYEIWVYSPRVEAVHLRGGAVARGGIRWSTAGRISAPKCSADEGADGEERGHRAGRREGRLRREARRRQPRGADEGRRGLLSNLPARPAGRDRQPRRRQGRAAARGGAPRRRRSLSGGGGGQRHGDLLRLRQRDLAGVRLLAGRRVRFRRLGRLRPQGHGHHGARRVGIGQAHFRELGIDTQASEFTVVGIGDMSGDVFGNGMLLSRKIRLLAGLRPPPRLSRSGARRGEKLARKENGCSSCRAPRGPTTTPS